MFDMGLAVSNGALCLVAIFFAAHVKEGRVEAICLAALLFSNFVFCALGYTDHAPKYALHRLGLDISTKELWAIADAIFGSLTMIAFRFWWAWALWAGAITQVLLHAARISLGLDEFIYSDALQVVLLGQIAVFFLIGGRGVRDWINRLVDRIRVFRGTRRATTSGARTSKRGSVRP